MDSEDTKSSLQRNSNLIDLDNWDSILSPLPNGIHHETDGDSNLAKDGDELAWPASSVAVTADDTNGHDDEFVDAPETVVALAQVGRPGDEGLDDFLSFASSVPQSADGPTEPKIEYTMDNDVGDVGEQADEFEEFGENDGFNVEGDAVEDEDEFGDFDEGQADIVASAPVEIGEASIDDEFGNFGGEEVEVGKTSNEDDFGDFGDFGDFDEGNVDVVISVTVKEREANIEDEFGDFDEGNTDLAILAPVKPVEDDFGEFDEGEAVASVSETAEQETPAEEPITIDPKELKSLASLLSSSSPPAETLPQLTSLFDKLFPGNYPRTAGTLLESGIEVLSPEEEGPESAAARHNDSNFAEKERTRRRKTKRKMVLCTTCSEDLWNRLSRDAVFYNPITGSVGQFQWSRSHTHREYLEALGVQVNLEEVFRATSPAFPDSPTHELADLLPRSSTAPPAPRPTRSLGNRPAPVVSSSELARSMPAPTSQQPVADRAPPEDEPELDLDIARAYCELTEATLHVFPITKLQTMAQEMTRLHRQATEYLEYLLDQREQLLMDSETYNDLISCIVGHAQRMREQAPKDATAAKVSKRRNGTSSLQLSLSLKRKPVAPTTPGGVSMGGGVVGVVGSGVGPAAGSNGVGMGTKLLSVTAGGGGKSGSSARRLSM